MFTILAYDNGIWATLLTAIDKITGDNLAGFQGIAVSLAAMLACFSLLKFATSYVQGENSFSWKLLRPIVILICTIQFDSICTVFDHTIGVFARDIAAASDGSFAELVDAFNVEMKINWDNIEDAGEQGFFKKAWEFIKEIVALHFKQQNVSTLAVCGFLARGICELVFIVFEVLSAFFLGMLRLMGPFILAMSIPEHWKTNVAQYVSRYIQIYLWVPIGYLNIGLITMISRTLSESIAANSGIFDGIGALGLGLALAVAAVTSIFAIPKIAGWIIESAGSGNAQSPLEKGTGAGARRLFRIG